MLTCNYISEDGDGVDILFNDQNIGTCYSTQLNSTSYDQECFPVSGFPYKMYSNGTQIFITANDFSTTYCGTYICRDSANSLIQTSAEIVLPGGVFWCCFGNSLKTVTELNDFIVTLFFEYKLVFVKTLLIVANEIYEI